MEFKKGFTFRVTHELVSKLVVGSYWTMIKEPEVRPDVPLHQETAVFIKLDHFKIPKTIRMYNTIYLSESAIKRYVEMKYIILAPDFVPQTGYPVDVKKKVYDLSELPDVDIQTKRMLLPDKYPRTDRKRLKPCDIELIANSSKSGYVLAKEIGMSETTIYRTRREMRERGDI